MATPSTPAPSKNDAWVPPQLAEFEKLGAFYLGRPYNFETRSPEPGVVLYDSKDLLTHAVCVGMTGSGKTGLCVGLVEEAAIDGIPTIAIDPKGDLANLLLTFPDLGAADFRPWVNEDDAQKKGMTPEQYAEQQSSFWRSGLASWGQDGERIRRLREAAEFTVYTPGSTAGVPVSILASFAAPPANVRADHELLLERVNFTATSLLGLLGISADPVQSRDHILISHLLNAAWGAGRDLDLAALITQIQNPPLSRIGVLDLESFYPERDRQGLAMAINNILASPGFATWLNGEPLDIGRVLYTDEGKPRVAIFSIAHLPDKERMFFVSLLLTQVVAWVRQQPGTSSLRAMLYIDEVFGYFPPVAEPPSKRPLLTLLKQARAHGLGVVLATQNPADLDYKGLGNAGTWLLGRLQTERDKQRVIEGLEGASAVKGAGFDKARLEQMLAGLGSRVFLMNNVHEDEPVLFQTRWTMSYLRGPLTRDQIRTLMADRRSAAELPPRVGVPVPPSAPPAVTAKPPVLSTSVAQFFIPPLAAEPGLQLVYEPRLFGAADIRFADRRIGIDFWKEVAYLASVAEGLIEISWDRALPTTLGAEELRSEAPTIGEFSPAPSAATSAKSYDRWRREFAAWLLRNAVLDARQISREQRDAIVSNLRAEYAPKMEKLEAKIRGLERDVEQHEADAKSANFQSNVTIGATFLKAMFGRKRFSSSSVNRATSASRRASTSARKKADTAGRDLSTNLQAMAALQRELDEKIRNLDFSIRPTKTNIQVRHLALVWAPHWRGPDGTSRPAWR